jgi:hypothetical protein
LRNSRAYDFFDVPFVVGRFLPEAFLADREASAAEFAATAARMSCLNAASFVLSPLIFSPSQCRWRAVHSPPNWN